MRRDLLSDILDGLGRVRGRPPPRRPQAIGSGRRRPQGGPKQPPRFSPPRRPNSQPGPPRRPQSNQSGAPRRPQNNRPRPSQRPQSNRPGPPRTATKLIFVDQPLPPVFQAEAPSIKNIPSSFDSQDLVSVNNNKQIPTFTHHEASTTRKSTVKHFNTTPPPSTHFQTFSTFRTPTDNAVENELSNLSNLPFLESIPASQGFTPEISSPFSSFPRTSGGTSSPSFPTSGPSSSSFALSGPSTPNFSSSGPSSSSFSSPGASLSSFPDGTDSLAPSVSLPASSSFVNLPSQDLQFEQQSSFQDLPIQHQNPVQELQFKPPASESSTFFSSKLPNLSSPSLPTPSAPAIDFNLLQSTPVRKTFSSPASIPAFKEEFGQLEVQPVEQTTRELLPSSPKSLSPTSCRLCRVRSCFAQCR